MCRGVNSLSKARNPRLEGAVVGVKSAVLNAVARASNTLTPYLRRYVPQDVSK
jgi:hypothetical protein